MKVKNLNKSSIKTKNAIKKAFAQILFEVKDLNKINVASIIERADISRSTFYTHYSDIYTVAEDYEDELFNQFFDSLKLLKENDFDGFINAFFKYIKSNDETYKMLCSSNDFLFSINKLIMLVSNNVLEICNNHPILSKKNFLELKITVFISGIVHEYIKYCRGYSYFTPDDLCMYAKHWYKNFINEK